MFYTVHHSLTVCYFVRLRQCFLHRFPSFLKSLAVLIVLMNVLQGVGAFGDLDFSHVYICDFLLMSVLAFVCIRVFFVDFMFTFLFTKISSTNPVQSIIEKTFQLTRTDKDLLAKQEYDVQVGRFDYSHS